MKHTDQSKVALTGTTANEIADVVNAFNRNGVISPGSKRPDGTILIRNDTGGDLSRYSVVGIGASVCDPATKEMFFDSEIVLAGETPTLASHVGKFAILGDAIRKDQVGFAHVRGFVQATVEVIDEAHGFADVTDSDSTKLTSNTTGNARIVWKESGTGTKRAIVELYRNPTASGVRFKNISSYTAPLYGAMEVVSIESDGTVNVTRPTEKRGLLPWLVNTSGAVAENEYGDGTWGIDKAVPVLFDNSYSAEYGGWERYRHFAPRSGYWHLTTREDDTETGGGDGETVDGDDVGFLYFPTVTGISADADSGVDVEARYFIQQIESHILSADIREHQLAIFESGWTENATISPGIGSTVTRYLGISDGYLSGTLPHRRVGVEFGQFSSDRLIHSLRAGPNFVRVEFQFEITVQNVDADTALLTTDTLTTSSAGTPSHTHTVIVSRLKRNTRASVRVAVSSQGSTWGPQHHNEQFDAIPVDSQDVTRTVTAVWHAMLNDSGAGGDTTFGIKIEATDVHGIHDVVISPQRLSVIRLHGMPWVN